MLFATVFSIGTFTRYSEITAAKASGISFYRFIAPILFMGGWLSPFQGWLDGGMLAVLAKPGWWWLFAKAGFFAFAFLWFRASFPRYRYDQIMRLGWKVFIPITLVWIFFTAVAAYFNWFVRGA